MTEIAHKHLSQLAVERYLLGELAGETLRRVEAEIEACAACRRRVDETAADDAAFTLRPMPAAIRALAAALAVGTARSWSVRWLIAVPAAAAAAAIVIAVLWTTSPPADGGRPEPGLVPGIGARVAEGTLRAKGSRIATPEATELELGFYLSEGGDRRLGRPGETLAAGDRIQFWYDGRGAPAFALVGVDGRGAITRYLPENPGEGRALPAGRGASLGVAIELDDAKGVERFFLCAGPDAADPRAVEEAARSLVAAHADLSTVDRLPLACDQASAWIRKE
jgi:hypothetical protein